MAIEHGESRAILVLASLYKEQNKLDIAEKYYLMAIEHGESFAILVLACLYKEQNKLDIAEKYYLMAIEHEETKAITYLKNMLNNDLKLYQLLQNIQNKSNDVKEKINKLRSNKIIKNYEN